MSVREAIGWGDNARAVLRQAGCHRGAARDEVIALLDRQVCALSALEIEDALRLEAERRRGRAVARASIYRVLELLAEHGLVSRLEVGDGIARYELIDPAGDHHHHLLCEACGELVPFHDPDLERCIERLSRRLGFRTDEHEVVLRGTCARCGT